MELIACGKERVCDSGDSGDGFVGLSPQVFGCDGGGDGEVGRH